MKNMAFRPWCAVAQYPNLARFLFGTVTLHHDARHDEIVSALADEASAILPPGFAIIEPRCGALFFAEGE